MKPCRLLIVEDEIILANDLAIRLAGLGHVVLGMARTGPAAIAEAAQHRPDLILMDIRLCGPMDGIDAAIEIRRTHAMPVIFLSAYVDEAMQARIQAAEPCGFLSKLSDDRTLDEAIETMLTGGRP